MEQWRRIAGNSKCLRQERSGDIQVSVFKLSLPISQAKLEIITDFGSTLCDLITLAPSGTFSLDDIE